MLLQFHCCKQIWAFYQMLFTLTLLTFAETTLKQNYYIMKAYQDEKGAYEHLRALLNN